MVVMIVRIGNSWIVRLSNNPQIVWTFQGVNPAEQVANAKYLADSMKLGEQNVGFQIKGVPASVAYRGVKGAPVQNVKGHYVPTRLAGIKAAKATTKPAATPAEDPWQAIADYPTPISNNGVAYDDGKIYIASEEGDVFVVRAGRTFEQLAKNPLGEISMATPAISEGLLYFRTGQSVIAIGQ